MHEAGHWLRQIQFGEPNYIKGPLHYIFLRVGIILFGRNMWATVYMNFVLVLIAMVALAWLGRRADGDQNQASHDPQDQRLRLEVWLPASFALTFGVYAFSFSSQMETELACTYVLGAWALVRAETKRAALWFWLLAGLAGLYKSPIHSVLLACGGLFFWLLRGSLFQRLQNPRFLLSALAGIFLCAGGYAACYVNDPDVFVATYVMRETIDRHTFADRWYDFFLPLFLGYPLPWTLLLVTALVQSIRMTLSSSLLSRLKLSSLASLRKEHPFSLTLLGFALFFPSFLFYFLSGHWSSWYTIPVVPALVLLVISLCHRASPLERHRYQFMLAVTAFVLAFCTGALTLAFALFAIVRVEGGLVAMVLAPTATVLLILTGLALRKPRSAYFPPKALFAFSAFYISIGMFSVHMGERDLDGLRGYLARWDGAARQEPLGFYNLHRDNWSEWGYLNFMARYPIEGLHSEYELQRALAAGTPVIVANPQELSRVQEFARHGGFADTLQVDPWRRWGKKKDRKPGALREALETGDPDLLRTSYFIVRRHLEQ